MCLFMAFLFDLLLFQFMPSCVSHPYEMLYRNVGGVNQLDASRDGGNHYNSGSSDGKGSEARSFIG